MPNFKFSYNHPVKSLFTIHAGEFVAGEHIEGKFRNVNVWLPSVPTLIRR